MGFDIKSGLIARDFGTFLEKRLNAVFADKEVRLSGIEGGFRKLAIDDFSVYRKISVGTSEEKAGPSPIFSADKIIIKYRLLNIALRQFEKLDGIYLVSPSLVFSPNRNGGIALSPHNSSYFSKASAYNGGPVRFHILNGSITILDRKPILRNLEGRVTFHNSNLIFNDLKGTFLSLPVSVNGRIDNVLEDPVIKLRLSVKDKYYAATFMFKSTDQKNEGLIHGSLRLFDRFDVHFKGKTDISSGEIIEINRLAVTNPFDAKTWFILNGSINLSDKASKFIVTPKTQSGHVYDGQAGNIKIISRINEEKGLSVYAKLNHVDFFGHDVLSELDISANFYKGAGSDEMLKGTLKTRNLILNYKPFQEIEASWVFKKRELFITNFELEGGYRLFGKIKLSNPYDIDLNLSINNADLTNWLIFSKPAQEAAFSGLISGRIKAAGPLRNPLTSGSINVKDGNINDVRFSAINFNLKGKGPIFTISDSRMLKEGGVLYIYGEVDLKKFGRRNIFEDVKIETDQRVIIWEGWDITKSPSEIKAEKNLGEDFGVNFKTYVSAGTIDDDQKNSEIGLDYKIKKDDSINVRMKNDSAFVGVEHKIKF